MTHSRLPKSIKSTSQILKGPNHILHSLLAQSRDLLIIEDVVQRFVKEDVSVCSLKNNELTLNVPSGAIATKVRYRQRNIISTLHRAGLSITSLKIKVQPALSPQKTVTVDRHISAENAHQLAESAQYIEDERLREALLRLSRRSD
jgi:hypothetical protein